MYNFGCPCRTWMYSFLLCRIFNIGLSLTRSRKFLYSHRIYHFIYMALDFVLDYVELYVLVFNCTALCECWKVTDWEEASWDGKGAVW